MTFTVTYRDRSGAKAEAEIEAAGRAECVAECRARGIAPMEIREGRSGRSSASPKSASQGGAGRAASVSAAPRGGIWKAAILAAVLAVGGGTWWWFAARPGSAPLQAEVPEKAKSDKSVASPRPAARPSVAPAPAAVSNEPPPVAKPDPHENMKMVIGYCGGHRVTNWVAVATNDAASARRKRRFSSGLEEQLSWVFNTEVGDAPPVFLPPLSKWDSRSVGDILAREIVISDDDSERDKQSKRRMVEVKRALKEYIDAGGKAESFIEHYHSFLKQANAQWKDAKRSVIDLYRTERDPNLLKSYIIKVNEGLAEKGIKPITLPKAMCEELGIEAENGNQKEK